MLCIVVGSRHEISSEKVAIPAEDGRTLDGILVRPEGTPRAACVLHGATAVPKEFYLKFAKWLASEKNIACLVYDYRGMGGSRDRPVEQEEISMSDWQKDQSAALDFLIARMPGTEHWAIGHSVGGLFLNTHKQSGKLTRAFSVASGAANWLGHPVSAMPFIAAFWWLVGPVLTKILGYTPDKFLGQPLPKNVFWEWRRWCLSHDFFNAAVGKTLPPANERAALPSLKMIAIADDQLITPAMVQKLMPAYKDSKVDYQVIKPEDIGAKKLGHTDIFAARNKAGWEKIIS